MVELIGKEREIIEPLCKGREEEVTIYGTMEGHMGKVWADKKQLPECAVVLAGDFFFLLGSCMKSEEEAIIQILSEHRDCIIILDEQIWAPLLEKLSATYPESYKSFLRYAMNGTMEWFEKDKLHSFIGRISPEFILKRIDATEFELTKKDGWSEDFCSNFRSVEEFEEFGVGYLMFHEGEIVAGASTYGYCKGKIEIQIETKKEFRRRGLALACGAKLILECLEKNIYPRWDAANLDSVALAEKLGYRFSHEYQVYSI